MVKRKGKGEAGCSESKRSKPQNKQEGARPRRTRSRTFEMDGGKRKLGCSHDASTSDSDYDEKVVFKKKQLRKKKKMPTEQCSGPISEESSGEICIKKQVFRRIIVSETESESTSEGGKVKCPPKKMKTMSKKMSNVILDASTSDYTSDSDRDLRKVRLIPTNYFENVSIEHGVTYYRSNMETAIKDIKGLNFEESHLNVIRRIPSWYMFEAIQKNREHKLKKRCHKNDEDIRKILICYDMKTGNFIVGGKEVELNGKDVALIFGIVGGTEKIPFTRKHCRDVTWVQRNFEQERLKSINKSRILDKIADLLPKIDETSLEDVARLTHFYLMASVLAPGQSSSVAWHLAYYLEDLDKCLKYDWCAYIAEVLLKQIKSSRNLMVGGCALLLPYWLCEHTALVQPKEELLFPRFLKWDLKELTDRFKRLDLTYLGSEYVIDAWGDLLTHKYGGSNAMKTTIFTASTWDLIARPDSKSTSALTNLIDNRLEMSLQNNFLLFPLNTKAKGKPARGDGFHWTLLKLNMKKFEWQFFNSLPPRKGCDSDVHFKRCKDVANYIERKMRDIYRKKNPDHPFLDNSFIAPVYVDSIQQAESSLDCGIIVCVHIENAILKRTIPKKVYNENIAGNYRKKMVELFLESESLS